MEVRIIFGLLKLKNISNIREEILLYFLFAVKVFIMIGVNDIMRGKSVDEIYANYLKIIQVFEEKNIKIYIQSTLYIGETRKSNFNSKVEELNKKLEKYASENKIIFINLNPIFAPQKVLKKEFTFDDLHLNGTAYKLWTQEIKNYF